MMRRIFLIVFLFFNLLGNAQDFEWVKTIGGPSTDAIFDINLDSSGNIYLSGRFYGSCDFDPGPGVYNITASGNDMFICKYDSLGGVLWVNTFDVGGAGNSTSYITIDNLGNVIVTGAFSGTCDFDPSATSVYNATATPMGDEVFVLKLDINGNFVWVKTFTGSANSDEAEDIIADNLGNIYICGYFRNTVDFDPGPGVFNLTAPAPSYSAYFLSKLDQNGNFIWATQYWASGVLGNAASAMALDGENNIYLTGSLSEVTSSFVSKYDNMGTLLWIKEMPSSAGYLTGGYAISIGQNKDIYVAGRFAGACDFDPGPGTFNLSSMGGDEAAFVLKLDSIGNFVWANSFGSVGGAFANSLILDPIEDVYISGSFSGTIDFDPGAGVVSHTSVGSSDNFLSKLTSSGMHVWTTVAGGTSSETSGALEMDQNGSIFFVGSFSGTVDFDFGPLVSNAISTGGKDGFIQKTKQDFCSNFGTSIDTVLTASCSGPAFAGSHSFGSVGPYTYSWNTMPSTNDSIAYFATGGIFTLTSTNAYGCLNQKSIVIAVPSDYGGYNLNANLTNTNFRPGFDSNIWLDGFNNGCIPVTGTMSIVLDPLVTYNNSIPLPDVISGDTLKWNFISLIYDSIHVVPQVDVTTSTSALIGDSVCFDVFITPIIGDADTTNNIKHYCFPVLNGYDPNDKHVYPQGECANHFVLSDERLTYTIRFQNTGNADAINISVIDSLDSNLDLNSVRVVGNSHSLITEVLPGNVLKFCFNNIYLPDSTSDEANSHGYVIFEVGPLPNLPNGTLVENTSDIYFDFNPPIITNTTFNTFVDTIENHNVNENITIQCGDTYIFPDGYALSGINASIIHVSHLSSNLFCDSIITTSINVSPLNTNITSSDPILTAIAGYNYQWIDCDANVIIPGETSQSFTAVANGNYAVIVTNGTCSDTSACYSIVSTTNGNLSNNTSVKVYPNPTNSSITIQAQNAQNIWVLDLSGRTLMNIKPTGNNTNLDLTHLQSGVYFVKVKTLSGESTVKLVKQ